VAFHDAACRTRAAQKIACAMKPWAEALVNRMVLFAPICRRHRFATCSRPQDQPGALSPSRTSGGASLRTCQRARRRFRPARISRKLSRTDCWSWRGRPRTPRSVRPVVPRRCTSSRYRWSFSGLPSQEAVDCSRQDTLVLSKPLRWLAATLLTTVSNRTEGRGHERANAGCRECPLGLPACTAAIACPNDALAQHSHGAEIRLVDRGAQITEAVADGVHEGFGTIVAGDCGWLGLLARAAGLAVGRLRPVCDFELLRGRGVLVEARGHIHCFLARHRTGVQDGRS
jgi:hypothetical protein